MSAPVHVTVPSRGCRLTGPDSTSDSNAGEKTHIRNVVPLLDLKFFTRLSLVSVESGNFGACFLCNCPESLSSAKNSGVQE